LRRFIKNNYKTLLLATVFSSFYGCSGKLDPHGEFNADFKKFTDEKFPQTQSESYVKSSIVEVVSDKKYIGLDNMKRISTALEELGNIDGKVYLLSPDSEDVFLPAIKNSHKLGLSSFDRLNRHIQDTTNYFIYIKESRFQKDRIKIVTVKNKEVFTQNLKDIPFSIDGKMAISDVLEQLKHVSGFNVVAKGLSDGTDKKTEKLANEKLFSMNSMDDLFDNTYISFSGKNIMELLNYISTSFNVYVDVDYENKTIVFTKLKPKMFNVSLSNIEYSGSLDVKKTVKNDVGSGGSDEKSVKTKIEFDILKSLETDIEGLIKKSNKGASFTFNRTVGTVFAIADKETMQNLTLLINNFNSVFEKQVDFQLEIYEFAVTQEFDMAVSLGATIKNGTVSGSFLSSTVGSSMFSLASTQTNGEKASVEGSRLENSTIRLLKQTKHGYILKNSIPYFIDITDSKSYVKTVTKETTTTNGVSTSTSTPETSEISEGTVLSVLSKVNGNKIEFNIQPKIVRINAVTPAIYDGNTITLPDISTNTFSSNIMMENGEKKVIGHLTTYEDANDYSGIVPIENFVLGGARNKKYFRKETVFVVSAAIRD